MSNVISTDDDNDTVLSSDTCSDVSDDEETTLGFYSEDETDYADDDGIVSMFDTRAVTALGTIEFGIADPDFIRNLSVCEITESKLALPGSVYDERLGTMNHTKPCVTCKCAMRTCPGHYGHIELAVPICHPLMMRSIIMFLRCFCMYCYRLRVFAEHLRVLGASTSSSRLVDYVSKRDFCQNCQKEQPKYTYNVSEGIINAAFNDTKFEMTAHTISIMFANITDSDLKVLKFRPERMNPASLVLTVLPVIPTRARPFAVSAMGICDDDLTVTYGEIIKLNTKIRAQMTLLNDGQPIDQSYVSGTKTDEKLTKLILSLKFRVKSLMDNSNGKSKHINNRSLKGIKERLSGKTGLLRGNLLGKRCNQSARSVLGPDPTLAIGEIALPHELCRTLTEPIVVNDINRAELLARIRRGEANSLIRAADESRLNLQYAAWTQQTPKLAPGDIVLRAGDHVHVIDSDNSRTFVLESGDAVYRNGRPVATKPRTERPLDLVNGDIVECQLRNGSLVIVNRMPTLHAGSFTAHRVVVRPGKTIRIPLSITGGLAADCDGDEVNIYAPITQDARAELATLVSIEGNFMSSQSGSSNVKIIQDGLLGIYMMTLANYRLSRARFFQLAMCLKMASPDVLARIDHYRRVVGGSSGGYTTYMLVSLFLPHDFFYDPLIVNGCLVKGPICKKTNKGSNGSITVKIAKEYSSRRAMHVTDCFVRLADAFLHMHGFTISLSDCVVPAAVTASIKEEIWKGFAQAEVYANNSSGIAETRIGNVLSNTASIGMKIADNYTALCDNGFVTAYRSGCKGAAFNVAQITGTIGQQIHKASRIAPTLVGPTMANRRTMVHYAADLAVGDKYESRGFVRSSFLKGMNPREFFMHHLASRESIVRVSMSTSNSGYAQRRMVEYLKNLSVRYDGSVRDTDNKLVQIKYGDDGTDGRWIIHGSGGDRAVDVDRIRRRYGKDVLQIVERV